MMAPTVGDSGNGGTVLAPTKVRDKLSNMGMNTKSGSDRGGVKESGGGE